MKKIILYILLCIPLALDAQWGFYRPLVAGDTTNQAGSKKIATQTYVKTHSSTLDTGVISTKANVNQKTGLNVLKTQTINGTAYGSGNIALTKSSFAASDSATNSVQGFMTAIDHTELMRLIPLTGQTFSGQFNMSTGGEVSYKIYACNVALTPTIAANPVENSLCRVVIDAGASASLVATNLGTLRAGSDTFTVSKQNELIVFCFPDGTAGALVISYTIKVLN